MFFFYTLIVTHIIARSSSWITDSLCWTNIKTREIYNYNITQLCNCQFACLSDCLVGSVSLSSYVSGCLRICVLPIGMYGCHLLAATLFFIYFYLFISPFLSDFLYICLSFSFFDTSISLSMIIVCAAINIWDERLRFTISFLMLFISQD